jgi:hypothetical protein
MVDLWSKLVELSCTNPGCTFDMREDRDTRNAVANYLKQLAVDVRNDRVRHVSLSVHRVLPGVPIQPVKEENRG